MTTTEDIELAPHTQMSPVGRLEKVLLAADDSQYSESATALAFDVCEQSEVPLHIVCAITSGAWGIFTPGGATPMAEKTEDFLEAMKAKAAERGIVCTIAMPTTEDPADALIKEARRIQADIIIKGRRDSWDPMRLLTGDTTTRIIANAVCPVLVIPEGRNLWSEILLATDGSRSSDAATVMAATIAKCCKSPVLALSVRVPGHSRRRQDEAEAIAERAAQYLRDEGLEAVAMVEEGSVDDVVIDASRGGDSLIVLGNFGRTGFGKSQFGSKTRRIINNAKGGVLVVSG